MCIFSFIKIYRIFFLQALFYLSGWVNIMAQDVDRIFPMNFKREKGKPEIFKHIKLNEGGWGSFDLDVERDK